MPILAYPDVDLSYDVEGSGPPLLLLSATAAHCKSWKLHQVPEFARNHMVISTISAASENPSSE